MGYTVKSSRLVKSANGSEKRETAEFTVTLRGVDYVVECTIADRSSMTYKMLIGQNLMKDANIMVDPLQWGLVLFRSVAWAARWWLTN